jgi:hypothetical protein
MGRVRSCEICSRDLSNLDRGSGGSSRLGWDLGALVADAT